jgi:hypothetical protein
MLLGLLGAGAASGAEGDTAPCQSRPPLGNFFAGLRKAFNLQAAAAQAELEPPQCAIACEGKDVKVVILAEFATFPTNPILAQADYELGYRLTKLLEERYKENKNRVKIVSTSELKAYKNSYPKWREQTAQAIGKHFGADYVISLEISDLRLDHPRNPYYYHRYADIDISVTDVSKPVGEGEKFHQSYSLESPHLALEGTKMTVSQFRGKLIEHICEDMVQLFAAHPPKEEQDE